MKVLSEDTDQFYLTAEFQKFFEKSANSMVIKANAPHFTILAVSNQFLEITLRKRCEFLGQNLFEVFPGMLQNFSGPRAGIEMLKKAIESKERMDWPGFPYEIINKQTGKTELQYWSNYHEPILNDDDEVAYLLYTVVALEITDQMQARKELENAYEQLRLSKEAAELGTFDFNLVTGDMDWDARCRILFGVEHQDKIDFDRDFISAIDPLDRDIVLKLIDTLMADESLGGNYDSEFRIVGEEKGLTKWVRAKGKIFFQNANPVRFIGSMLDITDQKESEQRKNDFIGMVSHELKTPLTSMMAYQQMLQKKLQGTADGFTKVAIDKSNQQIRKMTALINGFLNISNLESGKIKLVKETFDVKQLLEEVIEDFILVNSTHEILLNDCSEALVYADREKISSVISNLISNAIKYSPNGKKVEVDCKSEGEMIKVSVTDEGMGIKESDQVKLFERFYRISTSHRQNISGFGIGLYLSKEIIERHNGKIWLESKSGKGSVFTFVLPAQF